MKLRYLLAASVVSLAATTMVAAPAAAQQIVGTIEGRVVDDAGAAVGGAVVTVLDTRNGSTRTFTTGSDGSYRALALQPGGPFVVSVAVGGFDGQTIENIFVGAGGRTAVNFTLDSAEAGSESMIIVSGARAVVSQVATGPGSAFGTEELISFPSLNRDIRDIIRIDPRVSLNRTGGANDIDGIRCLGGNDRTNTFTVDGIKQADIFGLNGTPFAGRQAAPIPFDVIGGISVEFAPFDVEFSDFTGCLINVTTKGGGNEFTGSAFVTYFDGGMTSDLNAGSRETRWGATLSGPIIKDRLFFSFGYEETDLGVSQDRGPLGSPNPGNPFLFVTQDQFDRFEQIARDVYGQDIGGFPLSLPDTSVRYFGRIDANISDRHRAELSYQRFDEQRLQTDFSPTGITGVNSFNNVGTLSDYYSGRFYSQWNDKISTELRVSHAKVQDRQDPFGGGEAQDGNPIIRLAVGLTPVPGTDATQDGQITSGPGFSRAANDLRTTINQARFQMNIDAGRGHLFKLGAEISDVEVFNLFVQNATGTLYFRNLDDFAAGLISTGTNETTNVQNINNGSSIGANINASRSGDINDSAASFRRQIYSFYAQDQWQVNDQLELNAGVRVQIFDGGRPDTNTNFLERYGFSNGVAFSSLDPLVLPRASVTYNLFNDGFFSNTTFTGGIGIFSGGDPLVWFSNAFSNDGFTFGTGTTNNCAPGQIPIDPATGRPTVIQNGQFIGMPQCVTDAAIGIAAQGTGNVQSIDPNLKLPTVTRANFGVTTNFGSESGFFSNWKLRLDYIYSKFQNNFNVVDLSQIPNPSLGFQGFMRDGRPIYRSIDPAVPGCNAQLLNQGGTPPTYTNVDPICFQTTLARNPGRTGEFQLTNGPDFESHVVSAIINKKFRGGILTSGGSTLVNIGYAYTDSRNSRNLLDATAGSLYNGVAAFDRQNPEVTTSNFEVRHNITMAVNFVEEFLDDYKTQFGFFFRANSGSPYSLTFAGGGIWDQPQGPAQNSSLVYVPTGVTDPNLAPTSNMNAVQSLIDYVANSGCAFTPGQTIQRNSCRNPWHFDLDFRFSQELPFLGKVTGLKRDKVTLFMDFDNFLNFIDSDWNVLRRRTPNVPLVTGNFDAQGRYVITNAVAARPNDFLPADDEAIVPSASAWRFQIGARYQF
jgi:hypothetical protein